jgi:hypothetical protein
MTYQGHRNYNAWNVALYLFNEEPLYREMCRVVRSSRTLDRAAERLMEILPAETADGVRYTKTNVRLVLQHWEG